jgi:transposase-like protein
MTSTTEKGMTNRVESAPIKWERSLKRSWELLPHYRVMYLHGIHFPVRHGTQTDATMILTALGVDLEGSREVLAFRASSEESKDGWCTLLQDLRTRGVNQIDLIITDGYEGLLAAVESLFPTTLRQRCLVHKQRNVMSTIPKREQQEVMAELKGIWQQEKKEDALVNLAPFKAKYQKRYPEAIRSLCEDEEHYKRGPQRGYQGREQPDQRRKPYTAQPPQEDFHPHASRIGVVT